VNRGPAVDVDPGEEACLASGTTAGGTPGRRS
jgi:hypothetical protein